MKQKFFTFCFNFTMPDGTKRTMTFCTETKNQAMCMYDDCCRNDLNVQKIINPDKITVIYDKDDAAEYGKLYGTPSLYKFRNKFKRKER